MNKHPNAPSAERSPTPKTPHSELRTPNSDGPTKTETLFGGFTISLCDNSAAAVAVRIKQLSLRECPLLDAAGEDELKQASIYSGLPVQQLEQLTPESQEAIILEGQRLNADFFARWKQRLNAHRNRSIPGGIDALVEKMLPALLANGALTSPISSSSSPSKAG